MSIIEEQVIDGITYSKWRPEYKKNNEIIQRHGIKTNAAYRQFIVQNADSIININRGIEKNLCCKDTNENTGNITKNSPYLFVDDCYDTTPYSYADSDLKQNYMDNYYVNCSQRIYSTN